MKFTCLKALTTHIIAWEGSTEITLQDFDISEIKSNELAQAFAKVPKELTKLIICNKDFFGLTPEQFERMMTIFKALPTNVKIVQIHKSILDIIFLDEQKKIKGIRSDLEVLGVDFDKQKKIPATAGNKKEKDENKTPLAIAKTPAAAAPKTTQAAPKAAPPGVVRSRGKKTFFGFPLPAAQGVAFPVKVLG